MYRVYDGAGVATTTAFDFKGHPTSESRQLVSSKTTEPDWSALLGQSTIAAMATAAAAQLDAETFTASSERDALGRVLVAVSPDGSEVAYGYDEGGGLQTVELKHRGSSTAQTVVGEIAYDARGQRTRVVYGSTSSPTSTTRYTYDPQTFRLSRLWTERGSDSAGLQSLFYHYDPVGNVTDIRDTAQQTVYFNNSVVEAANSYVYDAVYRLVEATGREHSSDGTAQRTHTQLPVGPQPMTSDPSAMRLYRQEYSYDAVGNLLTMKHIPTGGTGWTRWYEYDSDGNRLLANSAPGDSQGGPYSHTYTYDAHGSMTSMPHLSSMVWGHDDALQQVTVGTETVSFQYAGGIRSRKFVEKSGSSVTEERIYLGPWEIYRKWSGSGPPTLVLERESLHVSDGSGRILLVETKTFDAGIVPTPVGMWRYQLGNHLGSAAGEIDETGAVISYEEYHPYGTSAYRAVDSSVEVSARRYRYTGMERDEETGLGYHSARYYAPWLGRWTASDPIGLAGGINRFAYCLANPLCLTDPAGTSPPEERDDGDLQTVYTSRRDSLESREHALRRDEAQVAVARADNTKAFKELGPLSSPSIDRDLMRQLLDVADSLDEADVDIAARRGELVKDWAQLKSDEAVSARFAAAERFVNIAGAVTVGVVGAAVATPYVIGAVRLAQANPLMAAEIAEGLLFPTGTEITGGVGFGAATIASGFGDEMLDLAVASIDELAEVGRHVSVSDGSLLAAAVSRIPRNTAGIVSMADNVTPAGRVLTKHATESLRRHGFGHGAEWYDDVDDIISNPMFTTHQADGAEVFLQAYESGARTLYQFIVVGEEGVTTGLKGLTRADLQGQAYRYGWDNFPD